MKKIFIRSLICLLLYGFSNKIYAQCKPLPQMFVTKDSGIRFTREFSDNRFLHKSKYSRIKDQNNNELVPFSFVYTWEAMNDLLEHKLNGTGKIQLHFARVIQPNPTFPNIKVPQIVLLFSEYVKKPSKYYLITDDNEAHVITPADGESWIQSFEDINQPELRKTIRKRHSENYVKEGNSKVFSDTRSMVYEEINLRAAFLDEKKYQEDVHKIKLLAFGVQISAYTKKGRKPKTTEEDQMPYKRRLFVQFEYLQNTISGLKSFYLDEQDDYRCRLEQHVKKYHPELTDKDLKNKTIPDLLSMMSIDNGLLCPTNCP